MILHVLNSRSESNGYILEADGSALIIECGVPFARVRNAVDVSKIDGVVVSHRHMDHAKRWREYIQYGLRIYANEDTILHQGISHFATNIESGKAFEVGEFKVLPFDLVHDVPTNGFLIKHTEMGKLCFITDTSKITHRFPGVAHWIIEANYDYDLMIERVKDGKLGGKLFNRVQESHMSIEDTLEFMKLQDLGQTRTITLIHLSDSNSDADGFKRRFELALGKPVMIAEQGTKIDLSEHTF